MLLKWKWAIALRLPAKVFLINENGDYFWFDRGHLVPAKDRSTSDEDNDAVFFMTNIVPQSPKCNQGAWERFERYCRALADNGKELYIATGPHGIGGE